MQELPVGRLSGGLRSRARRWGVVGLVVVAMVAAACGGSGKATSNGSSGTGGSGGSSGNTHDATTGVRTGGSMTVLEDAGSQGAWPTGLDPPNDSSPGANQDMESAIYGELFELGAGGKLVPDLATGYDIRDGGLIYDFHIRRGVTFSDGTTFDAAAVAYNFTRDFATKAAHTPDWPLKSVTTPNPYTVEVTLTKPYSPLINSLFDDPLNWIVSPTALQKMGESAFRLAPVGAGPFMVVKDTPSSELVLKRNPHYWQKGLPYLDQLTFKDAASDESALEAMQSGQAQAYVLMSTLQLVKSFKAAGFQVTLMPASSPLDVQINTTKPPFDNIVAREALYYATDVATLDKTLNDNLTQPVQGFTAPGGLFYQQKVAGYRTYNLAKAKALVKQLGGLSFTLMGGTSATQKTMAEALQTMYQQAGMKVSLNLVDLAALIQNFQSNKWQATPAGSGSWDPAIGVGQNPRFLSTGRFSGVRDPKLDALLEKATVVPEDQRAAIYDQAAKYESDQAYAVELYPGSLWDVAAKDVSAPGLTTQHPLVIDIPEIWWQYAGYKK